MMGAGRLAAPAALGNCSWLYDGLYFGEQIRQVAVAVFHGEVVKRYRRWVELAASTHAVSC